MASIIETSNSPNGGLNILFLCTAHNSLSQRLSLVLREKGHAVTIELAISNELMVEAAETTSPDLIICPFLTKKVPQEVYGKYLTLIVHPGPPGDAGPSAIDWVLLGDDGVEPDASKALEKVSTNSYVASSCGRSHWGVTVLQAIEEFDAGPIWAWDQFAITLDGLSAPTKASLYRGPVTKAAVAACLKAIDRILDAVKTSSASTVNPSLSVQDNWKLESCTTGEGFLGGKTRTRPLLKPTQRDWDPKIHSAGVISRRLRASDSQPGVQSTIFFNKSLYLYGGTIEENPIPFECTPPGRIIAQRDSAVLISTADGKGVWVTHIRKLKPKSETLLPPKLPAMHALRLIPEFIGQIDLDVLPVWDLPGFCKTLGTFQEVWIEYEEVAGILKIAYVYSDFYNGASSTAQCQKLLAAIEEASRETNGICALVLMGGSYFNNGIHLGVCSTDTAPESWANINALNDCVKSILMRQKITTFAAIRGNSAAGGFALATCCDFVLSVENAVINPHYRAVGLYGSEYHSLTWYARAGEENTKLFMRGMLPMSATRAQELGLVDQLIPPCDDPILAVKSAVAKTLLTPSDGEMGGAPWTKKPPTGERVNEHRRMIDSVPLRKQIWMRELPQGLCHYRKQELDYMKLNFTDPRYHECVSKFTGKAAPEKTPYRFALHRRYARWQRVIKDAEEDINYFHYPNVDLKAVHASLRLPAVEPIKLVPPPSLLWKASSPANKWNSTDKSAQSHESRTNSDSITLMNATPPSSPKIVIPEVVESASESITSPDSTSSPKTRNLSSTISSNHRMSRVIDKLKSALSVPKVDEVDKADEALYARLKRSHRVSLNVPTRISLKNKPTHQMSCYYSAVDNK